MSLLVLDTIRHAYRSGGPFRRAPPRRVLEGASLRIESGECVALLGKSTLGRIALGLERPDAGRVDFAGAPLASRRGRIAPATRRAIQAVFQDPRGATSPRFDCAAVVAEPLHGAGLPRTALRTRVATLLHEVGLDSAIMDRPAHQLSGGQLQRLCIARALAPAPKLIVLDEAVNSLDMVTQSEILALLHDLRDRSGMAYLFITHDLRLLRGFADRTYLLEDGRTAEIADALAPGPIPRMLAELRAAMLPAEPHIRERTPVA